MIIIRKGLATMTSQENIKPKSIRLSILTALAANGITTVDDLQTQPARLSSTSALHAINDQLIERVRDDVTGMAAYQIAGRPEVRRYPCPG